MFARREKSFTTPSGAPLDATNLDDLLTQALETAYPEAITPLGFNPAQSSGQDSRGGGAGMNVSTPAEIVDLAAFRAAHRSGLRARTAR